MSDAAPMEVRDQKGANETDNHSADGDFVWNDKVLKIDKGRYDQTSQEETIDEKPVAPKPGRT